MVSVSLAPFSFFPSFILVAPLLRRPRKAGSAQARGAEQSLVDPPASPAAFLSAFGLFIAPSASPRTAGWIVANEPVPFGAPSGGG